MMVFDLDPGAPADIVQCCQVGLWLRDLLGDMKLESFAKTSGSKGLQVYVPLNTPVTFDQTKELSRALAEFLEREHPTWSRPKCRRRCAKEKCSSIGARTTNTRRRSVFIRFRAKEEPTVSTPVTWEEVANCLKKKKAALS